MKILLDKRLFIACSSVCLVILFLLRNSVLPFMYKKRAAYTIGIIQTASHPALDQAAQGFKDYFAAHHPGGVFITRNLQGDVVQAYSVAKSFNNRSSIDAVFAIGTLSAQAVVQTKKNKPICIAAVSNPEQNGIWTADGLVCGSSDSINPKEQLSWIKRVYPNIKVLGCLYSLYEPNACSSAENMKVLAESEGLIVKQYAISQPSDVPLIVQRIAHCDVIWCPTDNTIAMSQQSVINHLASPQALILSDNLLMKKGVYASIGVDYYQSGQETAKSLAQVLFTDKKPYEIPIVYPHITNIIVSKSLAEQYNPPLLDKQDSAIRWVE